MDDETDVRLVHAHPERVRRDDDAHALFHERVLHFVTTLVVEARVIRHRRDTCVVEHVRNALDGPTCRGIDHGEAGRLL